MFGALQNRDFFRCFSDQLVTIGIKAGRPDEDRNSCRNRAIEAFTKPRGRRKIDQHIAMVLIDREAGIFSCRRRDCLSHAPVWSEQADADRLVGGAHSPVMAEGGAPRNGGAPYRLFRPVHLLEKHVGSKMPIGRTLAARSDPLTR